MVLMHETCSAPRRVVNSVQYAAMRSPAQQPSRCRLLVVLADAQGLLEGNAVNVALRDAEDLCKAFRTVRHKAGKYDSIPCCTARRPTRSKNQEQHSAAFLAREAALEHGVVAKEGGLRVVPFACSRLQRTTSDSFGL